MEASREQQAMELVCRSLLGLTDLLRVAQVCKAWNAIIANELPRIKGVIRARADRVRKLFVFLCRVACCVYHCLCLRDSHSYT